MSVYLVVSVQINDEEEYKKYGEGARAALAPFDVKTITMDPAPKVYEGENPGNHFVIVQFQSQKELDDFYKSDSYQQIIHHRHAAADTRFIMSLKSA